VQLGPFVDADNPIVRSGDILVRDGDETVPLTSQELMQARVVSTIEAALRTPQLARTHVVLMSGYNDANCHPVHPQWPFSPDALPFTESDVKEVRTRRDGGWGLWR